ncbi:MAG: hypothetical protein ACR2PW_04280 [Gammaproteobacteria bacterium]
MHYNCLKPLFNARFVFAPLALFVPFIMLAAPVQADTLGLASKDSSVSIKAQIAQTQSEITDFISEHVDNADAVDLLTSNQEKIGELKGALKELRNADEQDSEAIAAARTELKALASGQRKLLADLLKEARSNAHSDLIAAAAEVATGDQVSQLSTNADSISDLKSEIATLRSEDEIDYVALTELRQQVRSLRMETSELLAELAATDEDFGALLASYKESPAAGRKRLFGHRRHRRNH